MAPFRKSATCLPANCNGGLAHQQTKLASKEGSSSFIFPALFPLPLLLAARVFCKCCHDASRPETAQGEKKV